MEDTSTPHKRLILVFPATGPGGVQSLIIRLVSSPDYRDLNFFVYDIPNGFISQKIRDTCPHRILTEDTISHQPGDVFCYFRVSWSVARLVDRFPHAKFLFYCVFPDTPSTFNSVFGINLPIFSSIFSRQALNVIQDTNGAVAMDGHCRSALQSFCPKKVSPIPLVPIPVDIPPQMPHWPKRKVDEICISYIARAENWKIFPLIILLNQLCQIFKFRVLLFTDNKSKFEQFLKKTRTHTACLSIYENASINKIKETLLEHSDLHVGMGTSALEGARLGIPTLLTDYTYTTSQVNYLPDWLHTTKEYCLGRPIETLTKNEIESRRRALECFSLSYEYRLETSKASYRYVKENHSLDFTAKTLFSLSNSCTTTGISLRSGLLKCRLSKVATALFPNRI